MADFAPRLVYPHLASIPRSYFLGHHRAGLTKMKTMIASIDLVIECRDYRTPLVSRNPLFEDTLGEKPRLIVYTKRDLGRSNPPTSLDLKRESIISRWDKPSQALFVNAKSAFSVKPILEFAEEISQNNHSILGSRMMIVGMPNVGKSSLLNSLRAQGTGKGKAAEVGNLAGVTRKIATSVKILEGKDGHGGVYVLDTPGVFVPYMPDPESMLKLALCGNVKDTLVEPEMVADYLLYHLNRQDPQLYSAYCPPTNDISELLDAIAIKQGRLKKGGVPDSNASAIRLLQMWRTGCMGHFVLDGVKENALVDRQSFLSASGNSLNQAKKAAREVRRQRSAPVEI